MCKYIANQQNHAYAFLKYALNYSMLISLFYAFVNGCSSPPPSLQRWWLLFFSLVSLFRRKRTTVFLVGGGGGGLVSSKFKCPPMKTRGPPPPVPPYGPTGKILATPLGTCSIYWKICQLSSLYLHLDVTRLLVIAEWTCELCFQCPKHLLLHFWLSLWTSSTHIYEVSSAIIQNKKATQETLKQMECCQNCPPK